MRVVTSYPFTLDIVTGIKEVYYETEIGSPLKPNENEQTVVALIPDKFAVPDNYPNPFNPSTTIRFNLPQEERVRIDIFNINGQLITTLVDKSYKPGFHAVKFDASHLASGIYLYRIQAGSFNEVRRMTLMK